MALISGIYDSGPIAPVAKIKENLSIWTVGAWSHYRIEFIEPMPASSQSVAELVLISGATTIAANGQVAAQLVTFLELNEMEFLHLRWEPLDDVEGVLWEQTSVGRYVTRSLHSRVSLMTAVRDPNLATTTFFILGRDRDANIEVQNPNPVALPQARFMFFGYRYVLSALKQDVIEGIQNGRIPSTWLPAEGRGAGRQ
ncbi:hypothetical protein LCGC14_0981290 [marine sediment metagenome]|uniref:Uncharacterized protein n=1 Tax=marine sediment metagenome TaxID=412755 RepID=A0A0F9QS12_9ZZZZ